MNDDICIISNEAPPHEPRSREVAESIEDAIGEWCDRNDRGATIPRSHEVAESIEDAIGEWCDRNVREATVKGERL